MTLDSLNRLDMDAAREQFLHCCGSRSWAQSMVEARPFSDLPALLARATSEWQRLAPRDWLEAFSRHPKIGDRQGPEHTRHEQKGTESASQAVLQELARLNAEYDKKFGHVFLICATGKSAEEMLDALRARMQNSAQDELKIAAGEQAKITRLRLEKLLEQKP